MSSQYVQRCLCRPLASTTRGFNPFFRSQSPLFCARLLTRGIRGIAHSSLGRITTQRRYFHPAANLQRQSEQQPHPVPTQNEQNHGFPQVKVRYLRPALWALSVSSGIFVLLAYLEARAETAPRRTPRAPYPQWQIQRQPPTPTEVVSGAWHNLDPISKVSWGIIITNGAIHLGSFLAPTYWNMLWHAPALNLNFTLLTSVFVHSGPLHFLFNMWACYNFLPPVGYSRLFEGNPYHTLSFFLSAGILSSYAQHLSTKLSSAKAAVPHIFIRSGGASGALFGIFGAFAMQYPTAGVGIIFLPFFIDAQYFLPAIMLFDFVGMVRGYSFLNFGHAAHFSGALVGVAYSYFDGKEKIWRPLVRFWRTQLLKH